MTDDSAHENPTKRRIKLVRTGLTPLDKMFQTGPIPYTPGPSPRGGLSWQDRIENYVRETRFPEGLFIAGDGRVVGTWIMGNDYRVKSGYYGGYPAGYLRRIKALFPDKRRPLHLFSGRVDLAAFPGDKVDVNPELAPTYVDDAQRLEGVPLAAIMISCSATRPIASKTRTATGLPHGEAEPRPAGLGAIAAGRACRLARSGPSDVQEAVLPRRRGHRHGEEHEPPLSRRDDLRTRRLS